MSKIFELFGFPITERKDAVEQRRKAAICPFMQATCDGGGNRHQTRIRLTQGEPLTTYFDHTLESVIPGICSISTGEDIWIVCPRRLFAARNLTDAPPAINFALQPHEQEILLHVGLPKGQNIGIWSEVYLKQHIEDAEVNYHFDYVAMPLANSTLRIFLQQFNLSKEVLEREILSFSLYMKKRGYYSSNVKDISNTVIQFPVMEHPFIFEIMTASTSGSNTENQTDIRNAFRNAIMDKAHECPGINKRQVWGRMVTQLFAKTALAHTWGGQTLWIIQDELLRNIELTTLLQTSKIAKRAGSDISLVVMHYKKHVDGTQLIALKKAISGDSGLEFVGSETFTDMLLPKTVPSKLELARTILRRSIDAVINL